MQQLNLGRVLGEQAIKIHDELPAVKNPSDVHVWLLVIAELIAGADAFGFEDEESA